MVFSASADAFTGLFASLAPFTVPPKEAWDGCVTMRLRLDRVS